MLKFENFHGVNFLVVYVNLYSFFLFWSAVSLTETHQRTHTVQLRRRNWFLNVLSVLVGAWWEEWVGSCQHLPWVQAYFGKCASSFPAQTSKSRSVSYLKDFFLLAHLIMSNVHLSIFLISLSLSLFVHIDIVNSAVDSFVSRQPENGSLPQCLSYTSTHLISGHCTWPCHWLLLTVLFGGPDVVRFVVVSHYIGFRVLVLSFHCQLAWSAYTCPKRARYQKRSVALTCWWKRKRCVQCVGVTVKT